jgi:N-acetylneuraminic acid mutarotase
MATAKVEAAMPEARIGHLNIRRVSVEHASTATHDPPPVPKGRFGHTCVVMGDQMIMFGGRDRNYHNDVWSYNFATKTWKVEQPAHGVHPPARAGHTAVAVGNEMIIFGGAVDRFHCTDDTWVLKMERGPDNRVTATWSKLLSTSPTIPSPRKGHTSLLVDPSTIVVFGGGTEEKVEHDCWRLDPCTHSWSKMICGGVQPCDRMYHVAEFCPEKKTMLVFGGRGATTNTFFNDLFELDLGTSIWREIQPSGASPSTRMCATSIYLNGSFCVMMGGSTQYFDDVFEFDVMQERWRSLPLSLSQACTRPTAVYHNCKVTLFGGNSLGAYVNDVIEVQLEAPSLVECCGQWLHDHLLLDDSLVTALPSHLRRFLHHVYK